MFSVVTEFQVSSFCVLTFLEENREEWYYQV